MSSTPNLGNIVGGIGSLIGNNAQTNTQNQAQGLLGSAAFTNGNVNNASGNANYTVGGGWNIGQGGALNGANVGLQNMAQTGTGIADSFLTHGAPAAVTGAGNMSQQSLQQQMAALTGGQGGSSALVNAGTNQLGNPLIGQAGGAASSNIAQAGEDFNSVYNTQLSSLMKQLQLPQQLQMNANQQGQFSRGQLGTTGGGLQTQAMATGFAQGDLAAQQQAQAEALATQGQAVSSAGVLGTLASNQQLTGSSMIGTGLGAMNNTASTIGNLGTQGLQNSIYSAAAPATLAGAYTQNTVTPAIAGTGAINTMGLNNANLALQTGQIGGNLNIGAGNGLAALGTSNNNSQSSLANLLSGLGGSSSLLNGILGGSNGSGGILNSLSGVTGAQNSINAGMPAMTQSNISALNGVDTSNLFSGDATGANAAMSGAGDIDTSWLDSFLT